MIIGTVLSLLEASLFRSTVIHCFSVLFLFISLSFDLRFTENELCVPLVGLLTSHSYPLAWIFSFPLCLFILRLHKGFVPSLPLCFFSWVLFGLHAAWFQPVRCIVPPAPAWPWRSPGRASARQASHLERFVISHQVPLLLHLCSASFPWT